MKKLRVLPSVLMMIMCVGVLAVGVFAVSPIVSTIGGTLSISAAPGVKVAVYNSESMSAESLVDSAFGGANTEVSLGEISLDGRNASTASDVTPKVFYVKLTTNQDKNYVVDTETIEYIDGVGVTSGEIVKNAGLVTKMHTYTATDSKGRACFNKTNPYTIKLTIKCGELSIEVVNMAFNLQLNIYEENGFADTEINGVDYLYFGSYPQSLASETLTGYTLNGEYYESQADEEYWDGEAWRTDMQRPVYTKNGDKSGARFVEVDSKLYKIEPLKWNILDQAKTGSLANTTGNTMLVSDLVLEAVTAYFGSGSDMNRYSTIALREYLTTTFYANAFNSTEEKLITITTVKNDKTTTDNPAENDYACEDTIDNVFALSYQDVINANYGFESDPNAVSAERAKKVSDYALATGADCDESSGMGWWWLRSPFSDQFECMWYVINSGELAAMGTPVGYVGCVPALHLGL